MPAAFLERAGYGSVCVDMSVEGVDTARAKCAAFVAISVPMHAALRLGFRAALRVREVNPGCHICFFGLYAFLNAEYLLQHVADSIIGGECEQPLTELVRALEEGRELEIEGVATRARPAQPYLKRLKFPVPCREGLPPLEKYAGLLKAGECLPVG